MLLPCPVEEAADPSLCSSVPLVIASWSSSSVRAVGIFMCTEHKQRNFLTQLSSSLFSLRVYIRKCNSLILFLVIL